MNLVFSFDLSFNTETEKCFQISGVRTPHAKLENLENSLNPHREWIQELSRGKLSEKVRKNKKSQFSSKHLLKEKTSLGEKMASRVRFLSTKSSANRRGRKTVTLECSRHSIHINLHTTSQNAPPPIPKRGRPPTVPRKVSGDKRQPTVPKEWAETRRKRIRKRDWRIETGHDGSCSSERLQESCANSTRDSACGEEDDESPEQETRRGGTDRLTKRIMELEKQLKKRVKVWFCGMLRLKNSIVCEPVIPPTPDAIDSMRRRTSCVRSCVETNERERGSKRSEHTFWMGTWCSSARVGLWRS